MPADIPETYKKLVVKKLTTNFREAVSVVTVTTEKPGPHEILIKNKYVGVNATDINISAGKYFVQVPPPYDIGLEGVGEVVAVGSDVTNFKVGQAAGYRMLKAYSEYVCVPTSAAFALPEAKPEYVALIVCGLTASVGLDKVGHITEGETVLVSAAAGGTGHIAVQWAKAAGCHVIGTCSAPKKMELLKSLGCDRVINYKEEKLDEVLKKEYPNGVNVVWETIGGEVFLTSVRNLATKGRLVIVGGISGYKNEGALLPKVDLSDVPSILLTKSAAIQGFLVLQYSECFETYFKYLSERLAAGELKITIDNGKEGTGEEFVGLEGAIRGVEHLHSGRSMGKVIVRMH